MMMMSIIVYILTVAVVVSKADYQQFPDEVFIETREKKCDVSEKFLSIAIDTKYLFKLNLNRFIEDGAMMNMLRGLHPAHLRIGGTSADLVIFDDSNKNLQNIDYQQLSYMDMLSWNDGTSQCTKHQWPVLHLTRERWLTMNALASRADLDLLFDLNVLLRQPSGKWNSTNAQKLIEFSQNNFLKLDWQLGNEPNSFCHVFGEKVFPAQLARDFKTLSKILSKYPFYAKSKIVGPDVTNPRSSSEKNTPPLPYLDKFLSKAKGTISAATWHQYYVNGRNATVQEFMSPIILDSLQREIDNIKTVVIKNIPEGFPIWISETSSAYGGGAANLSDRFVGGFMWLDKLGLAASNNISVVVRQSFIGGHYGLVGEKDLQPNPDFWISLLYKRLVGHQVLNVRRSNKNPLIRLYAHCHKNSRPKTNSLVLFGINVGKSAYKTHVLLQTAHSKTLKVDKYILTSAGGQMKSRGILLNKKLLKIGRNQELPPLIPVRSKTSWLDFPAQSMFFYVLREVDAPACE